jgi:hypothetical protein
MHLPFDDATAPLRRLVGYPQCCGNLSPIIKYYDRVDAIIDCLLPYPLPYFPPPPLLLPPLLQFLLVLLLHVLRVSVAKTNSGRNGLVRLAQSVSAKGPSAEQRRLPPKWRVFPRETTKTRRMTRDRKCTAETAGRVFFAVFVISLVIMGYSAYSAYVVTHHHSKKMTIAHLYLVREPISKPHASGALHF